MSDINLFSLGQLNGFDYKVQSEIKVLKTKIQKMENEVLLQMQKIPFICKSCHKEEEIGTCGLIDAQYHTTEVGSGREIIDRSEYQIMCSHCCQNHRMISDKAKEIVKNPNFVKLFHKRYTVHEEYGHKSYVSWTSIKGLQPEVIQKIEYNFNNQKFINM